MCLHLNVWVADISPESTTDTLPGFTLVGGFESKPVPKVKRSTITRSATGLFTFPHTAFFSQVDRVLPQWLAEPHVIHTDIKNNLISISDVPGLCAQLLKNLHSNGIQHFFPGEDFQ